MFADLPRTWKAGGHRMTILQSAGIENGDSFVKCYGNSRAIGQYIKHGILEFDGLHLSASLKGNKVDRAELRLWTGRGAAIDQGNQRAFFGEHVSGFIGTASFIHYRYRAAGCGQHSQC